VGSKKTTAIDGGKSDAQEEKSAIEGNLPKEAADRKNYKSSIVRTLPSVRGWAWSHAVSIPKISNKWPPFPTGSGPLRKGRKPTLPKRGIGVTRKNSVKAATTTPRVQQWPGGLGKNIKSSAQNNKKKNHPKSGGTFSNYQKTSGTAKPSAGWRRQALGKKLVIKELERKTPGVQNVDPGRWKAPADTAQSGSPRRRTP